MKLAILASHGGSNMQAIVDASNSGQLDAAVEVVISNNPGSKVLQRAEKEGIPYHVINSNTHPDLNELDQAMVNLLTVEHDVDLVVLAGYMKKLGPRTLRCFWGRIVNIHPALLPKFGGKGMYGDNVHRAVLSAGESVTGATVHVVTEEYDEGPILAQTEVPVYEDDTVDTLRERVLPEEHRLYVETLQKIAQGCIQLPDPGAPPG